MIRIVVLVLAAANLLFFGWSRWVSDASPRLVAPDGLAAVSRTRVAATDAAACASIGPLEDEVAATQVEQLLRDLRLAPTRRTVVVDQREGWWVYVPGTDARAQARALRTVQAAGSGDAFAVPEDPEFRVSAGVFSDEVRAQAHAASLRALQLEPVVAERLRQQTGFWFDLPGTAPAGVDLTRLALEGIDVAALEVRGCEAGNEASASAPPTTAAG